MLPSGAIGGVPLCGGIPWGTQPLFATTMVMAEMPWRAAGGEAHPMTTVQSWIPAGDHASLLIFEQLLRETVARVDEEDDDWALAKTVNLPIVGPGKTPHPRESSERHRTIDAPAVGATAR